MKKTRLLREALGVIFAASAALAAGTIVSGLMAWPWASTAIWFLPAALGQVGGRLAQGHARRRTCLTMAGSLAAAMLLSAAGLYGGGNNGLLTAWALAAILCFQAYQSRQPCAGGLVAWALILWTGALVLCQRIGWAPPYPTVTSAGATATCLAGIAVLTIQAAQRSTRGGGERHLPPALRRRVLCLAACLLGAALLLAIIPALRGAAGQGAGLAMQLLGTVFGGFSAVLEGLIDGIIQGITLLRQGLQALYQWLWSWRDALPSYSGSGWTVSGIALPGLPWTLLAILIRVLVVAVLVVLLWAMITGGIKLVKQAKTLVRKKPEPAPPAYSDQVRREFDPKKLLGRMAAKLKTAFRRKPRLSDFPDGAGKVRFAFSRWLRRCADGDPLALTQTPNELQAQTGQAALTAYYNAVRYGGRDAPEDAERVAKEALAALRAQTDAKGKRKHE